MATNFPASLDSLTNPTSSDSLNSPSHSAQHANSNDAIEALQVKVGADGSAVTSSHDYLIDKQSVVPYDDASARTTAAPSPVEGQMSYLKDTNSVEVYDGSAWAAVGAAGGKILQVVRATDTTNRTTTSGTFVDANISVTITPTDATSNILIIWAFKGLGGNAYGIFQITDPSNVAISGFDRMDVGGTLGGNVYDSSTLFVWDSPASTSAQTYKGRFRTNASYTINNSNFTGQIFAIEVGA